MENMEDLKNFTAAEVYADNETEELAAEMKNEREMEKVQSENEEEKGKSLAMAVGGYNKNKPPEDDCCPICFDSFKFPCRTSCGHWFCSICILQYWRYSANFKLCKCPFCSSLITKLIPESPVLNQPGEEVGKILENIQGYNRLTGGELPGLFRKILALPLLIRRRLRENLSVLTLRDIYNASCLVGILLGRLYDSYDLHFFPNGARGIELVFEIFGWALVIYFVLDFIRHHWMLRRRARHLAELADLQ